MAHPRISTREEWMRARRELLEEEKALTRQRDALNTERRNLPMVKVDKEYVFTGAAGELTFVELFEGRPQLILYHFMFDPAWDEGCGSCTAGTDEISQGMLDHLHIRDTTYAMTSRAPFAKIEKYRAQRGWDIAWYSTFESDFNLDFGVTIDESAGSAEYNFRNRAEHEASGSNLFDSAQPFEMPGLSCFLRVDGEVFHTYSTFARGLEQVGDSYYYLDLTALGRQEEWEEPKGRSDSVRSATPDFSS